MSEITQEYIKFLFNYHDGELYWKISKQGIKIGNKAGTLLKDGRIKIGINGKTYLNHRLIFLYHNGFLPKEIDHIDNNSSNNKIENLRSVTRSQNQWNRKSNINCSSKYKGVTWNKQANKWHVQIQINNKNIYLGRFINEIDAAIAYNKKAIELFGKYAYLNKIEK